MYYLMKRYEVKNEEYNEKLEHLQYILSENTNTKYYIKKK